MARFHALARITLRHAACGFSAWLSLGVPWARAAESGEPGVPARNDSSADETLSPPGLVTFVEAEYPPGALAEQREGVVVLKLTIARDGSVSDAVVAEAAGHGFDEAAARAALGFHFEPARRGGAPVASKIPRRAIRSRPSASSRPS